MKEAPTPATAQEPGFSTRPPSPLLPEGVPARLRSPALTRFARTPGPEGTSATDTK